MVDAPPETKEDKEHFGAWQALDLLPPTKKLDNCRRWAKAKWHASGWRFTTRQSVSHSDKYSVAFLQLHKLPESNYRLVLALILFG